MAGLKTDAVQIGQNATPSQNMHLRANNDGTFTLARGNEGAGTQDLLTIDAKGAVRLPANKTAWVCFDGNPASPVAIVGVNNVSITKLGTGLYRFTFNNIGTTNYAVFVTASQPAAANAGLVAGEYYTSSRTTTSVDVRVSQSGTNIDPTFCSIEVRVP